MTTRPSTLGDDLKAWAYDQLGVKPGFGADEVLRAYLRQVQHDNGNPNLTARDALLILTRQLKSARPTLALEAAEEALQRAVDDFAGRFFGLSVADRQAEWENLKARGQGFVRVDARLSALRAGVASVVPNAQGDPALGELIATISRLFVLRPAARAAARQAWLHEAHQSGQWDALVTVAVRLRQRDPALTALEPELLAALVDGRASAAERAQLQRRMRKAAKTRPAAASVTGNGSSWVWRLAPFAILFFCSRVGSCNSWQNRQPTPQPPAVIQEHRDLLEKLRKRQLEAKPGQDAGDPVVDQAVRDLLKNIKKPEPGAVPQDGPKPP
jgi:hypothetical protein